MGFGGSLPLVCLWLVVTKLECFQLIRSISWGRNEGRIFSPRKEIHFNIFSPLLGGALVTFQRKITTWIGKLDTYNIVTAKLLSIKGTDCLPAIILERFLLWVFEDFTSYIKYTPAIWHRCSRYLLYILLRFSFPPRYSESSQNIPLPPDHRHVSPARKTQGSASANPTSWRNWRFISQLHISALQRYSEWKILDVFDEGGRWWKIQKRSVLEIYTYYIYTLYIYTLDLNFWRIVSWDGLKVDNIKENSVFVYKNRFFEDLKDPFFFANRKGDEHYPMVN